MYLHLYSTYFYPVNLRFDEFFAHRYLFVEGGGRKRVATIFQWNYEPCSSGANWIFYSYQARRALTCFFCCCSSAKFFVFQIKWRACMLGNSVRYVFLFIYSSHIFIIWHRYSQLLWRKYTFTHSTYISREWRLGKKQMNVLKRLTLERLKYRKWNAICKRLVFDGPHEKISHLHSSKIQQNCFFFCLISFNTFNPSIG